MPSPENSSSSVVCTWNEDGQEWSFEGNCPSGTIPECEADGTNGNPGEVRSCNCVEVPN